MFGNFDFKDLFVLEMANNHQGDLEHGRKIIRQLAEVVKRHGVRAAIKFQFRQLQTFIHPAHRESQSNKHISRFLSTKLEKEEFQTLVDFARGQGLIPMCTPFDEDSVDLIAEMDLDIIKVGSCSAKDWPLLQKIADAGKPVIFSTGGLLISDIDNLVSFFDHRGIEYAMMHCVSIYPIPPESFNLSQIEMLRNRYPDCVVGWSTHEDPNETSAVQIAVAKGALMFERHVGVTTEKIALNNYSSTPEQIDKWIAAYKYAKTLCGETVRGKPTAVEADSLESLSRGIYLREKVKAGTPLTRNQIFFAMPCQAGQLQSGSWKEGIVAKEDMDAEKAIMIEQIEYPANPPRMVIQKAVHEVKALLNEAKIPLNSEFKVEYSHHYGMENFRETGCVIIDCVNREYCKKIIVQLPGQKHPLHFHKLKEETFQLLHGVLHVEIDGHHRIMHPGETLVVLPGVWHRFWTEGGAIFEEISTTHFNNDSCYQDKKINKMERHERKTVVDHWGRFQLDQVKKAAT
jgi:sialic acid synthase SpsE/quercetin dioxygenase-like cupin family protein